ncbi:TMEM223-like protein [Euroglyphus maynei]|uniref:TMEM223-like protein n=1 Tax=Euroglyphus maynei TaxID=6958 RepID=A0A1Y3AUS0_EURMA|nr:TMEM223-like protein [Euroglyphus maynei]
MLSLRILTKYCQFRFRFIFINQQQQQSILSSSKYFSTTKIDSETKSAWKSSSKPKFPENRPKLNRDELLKSLDVDLSYIKEEQTLFEIRNPAAYRGYFILIIANLLFWIVCANILYKFYSLIEERESVIERKKLYEQNKQQMKFIDRTIEYFSYTN